MRDDPLVTDAEFKVVHDPRRLPARAGRGAPRGRSPVDRNDRNYAFAPLRWLMFGLLGFAILMTILAGMYDPEEHPAPKTQPTRVQAAEGALAIPAVPAAPANAAEAGR